MQLVSSDQTVQIGPVHAQAGIVHVKPLTLITIGERRLSAKQLHTSIQKSCPKASNGPQPSAGLFGAFTLRFRGLCTAIRAALTVEMSSHI